jgi:hypothetical protein
MSAMYIRALEGATALLSGPWPSRNMSLASTIQPFVRPTQEETVVSVALTALTGVHGCIWNLHAAYRSETTCKLNDGRRMLSDTRYDHRVFGIVGVRSVITSPDVLKSATMGILIMGEEKRG